ncbi:MAG: Gfo/Idh/MocA family oxidoreductase [Bacteroidetes bacterium]|nr:Gfo/Idh/MocA family oxidoreductase [Bacteroidota bacterium]
MGKVKIAVLGVAHPHVNAWASAWHVQSEAELVGVWDRNYKAAQQWAEKRGITAYEKLEDVLSQASIGAVAICAENSFHQELTVRAAEAGKDILCEKPTAVSLEQCDTMIEAVEKSGARYMQAFPMRVDPGNDYIKTLLDKGEIGRVRTVCKRHGIGWAASDFSEDLVWFADADLSGGGALLDEGIHAADFLIWMFGKPKSVRAVIDVSNPRMIVEDNAMAIYEMDNGIKAVLETSWTYQAATNTTEIYGENGTIIQQFNDCASTSIEKESNFPIRVFNKRNQIPAWRFPRIPSTFMQAHELVAKRFVSDLVTGNPFPSTIYNGRDALEMILATYQAAKENRTVYLKGGESHA